MATQLIYGQEERLLPWAKERIGVDLRRDAYTIGLERNGEIVAVVAFDNFSKHDLCMHIASDGTKHWLSKQFLVSAFSYPFIQLGLPRVTALVPEHNKDALRFDTHLGFEHEGYHPKAGPDGSAVVSLGMLKESCRFIPRD